MEHSSACDRVFAITELLELFLQSADTLVLLNCQRVCRQWNRIISESSICQRNLFASNPAQSPVEAGNEVQLNPILRSHFSPLLGWPAEISASPAEPVLHTQMCTYDGLKTLPWARDGLQEDARARQAFSRKEASWRKMLISQPAIQRVDLYHAWETADRTASSPLSNGHHHSYKHGEFVSIGLLWDFLEPRLLRGCSSHLTYFVRGCSAIDDQTSSNEEKTFETNLTVGWNIYNPSIPRIRIRTFQIWPGRGPSMYQTFDLQNMCWRYKDELPFKVDTRSEFQRYSSRFGDGSHWLRVDCKRDAEEATWRWSKSDDFGFVNFRWIIGGGGSSDQERAETRRALLEMGANFPNELSTSSRSTQNFRIL